MFWYARESRVRSEKAYDDITSDRRRFGGPTGPLVDAAAAADVLHEVTQSPPMTQRSAPARVPLGVTSEVGRDVTARADEDRRTAEAERVI